MADVNTPTKEYLRLAEMWKLPRTLMGGTKAMRAAGIHYLPQEEAESSVAYDARRKRSTLFNAFRKTVRDMTGKVFTKPVVLEKDVPTQIKNYAENIDLAGRHINVFARDAFFDSMQVGIGFILTEMPPPIVKADGSVVTLADEQKANRRPYLIFVKVEDLIGWQSETINGVVTLTQARIRETACVPDGPWAEKEIEQIRVLTPGAWEIWRETTDAANKGNWVKFSQGTTSLDSIPLAPIYINRCGFMTGEPPLEDLADLNVRHWQSQSDQVNILHVARVPILFAAGFSDDAPIVIGAGSMTRASDPAAKLSWVEHSGAAIDSGNTDLENLEFQMQTMGLQLLVPQPGGKTATGVVADDEKENAPLAMMAGALQDAIEQSLGFMAEYMSVAADGDKAGGSVIVNKDFGIGKSGNTDLQQLLAARVAGEISRETFWSEMQRRGFLSDSFDPVAEATKLDDEKEQNMLDAGNAMNLDEEGNGGPDDVKVGISGRASVTAKPKPPAAPAKAPVAA